LTLAMGTVISAVVVMALGHDRKLELMPSRVEQNA
jgi:hypothetical protein